MTHTHLTFLFLFSRATKLGFIETMSTSTTVVLDLTWPTKLCKDVCSYFGEREEGAEDGERFVKKNIPRILFFSEHSMIFLEQDVRQ